MRHKRKGQNLVGSRLLTGAKREFYWALSVQEAALSYRGEAWSIVRVRVRLTRTIYSRWRLLRGCGLVVTGVMAAAVVAAVDWNR